MPTCYVDDCSLSFGRGANPRCGTSYGCGIVYFNTGETLADSGAYIRRSIVWLAAAVDHEQLSPPMANDSIARASV